MLTEIYNLKNKLSSAKEKDEFDGILEKLGEADIKINKDALTEDQQRRYDELTKECTDLISQKMRELEHRNNMAYNKRAVSSYADAFSRFKRDESKYTQESQLYALASETLFAYDAARLFNETLVYYNHVYSYIFSKLDDSGKLALTRFSIECERKRG